MRHRKTIMCTRHTNTESSTKQAFSVRSTKQAFSVRSTKHQGVGGALNTCLVLSHSGMVNVISGFAQTGCLTALAANGRAGQRWGHESSRNAHELQCTSCSA